MNIGILLLVLAAAGIATSLPARNQPIAPPTPARISTSSNNEMSASGCKSSTLRWGQIRPTLFSSLHSKITFELEGRYYFGKLPFHKDTDYQKQWCSDDKAFCVTHASGVTDKSLTIMFNGLLYYHPVPNKIYTHDPDAFNYEYWGCVS